MSPNGPPGVGFHVDLRWTQIVFLLVYLVNHTIRSESESIYTAINVTKNNFKQIHAKIELTEI